MLSVVIKLLFRWWCSAVRSINSFSNELKWMAHLSPEWMYVSYNIRCNVNIDSIFLRAAQTKIVAKWAHRKTFISHRWIYSNICRDPISTFNMYSNKAIAIVRRIPARWLILIKSYKRNSFQCFAQNRTVCVRVCALITSGRFTFYKFRKNANLSQLTIYYTLI